MRKYDNLIKAIDNYIAKSEDDLEETLESEGRVIPKETVVAIAVLETKIADALIAETEFFVKQIKKQETLMELMDVLEEIKAKDIYCDAIRIAINKQLKIIVPKCVKMYIKEFNTGITSTNLSKRTTDWIERWSADLADIMKLNSHKEIEHILKKGLEKGSSIATVTKDIMDSGIRNEYYKARRVAVTEMLRAHNVSKQEAFMQDPSVVEKMWMHTGSYRNTPRQNHIDMSGKIVNKSEPFVLECVDGKTRYPQYPQDTILPAAESINCHCIVQPVVSEKILGLSIEERKRLQAEAVAQMDDEWEKELDAKNKAKAGIDE